MPTGPDQRGKRALVPDGWRVVLDPSTRRPAPRVLLGGSPGRILRLTDAGDRVVDAVAVGCPVTGTAARRLAGRLVDAGLAWPRPGPGALTDIGVVVPCLDRPVALATTLAALPAGVAVTVVDDGSADPGGIGRVASARPATTVLRRTVNGGPAAARNDGWRAGDTEIVAFVDTECTAPAGWLAALAGHFADPAVGAVAPRVTGSPGRGRLAAYERARGALDRGPRPGPVRPRSHVPYVPSTALLVRRSALVDVGGFDEALRTGEDVDLVWRLDRAGWRLRYDPDVVVGHPSRPGPAAWVRQRFGYGRSAAPLAARHGRAVAPLAVTRWSAAAWALVGLGHPALGAITAAGSTVRLAVRRPPATRPLPATTVLGVGWRGHVAAGRSAAEAVRRTWWPAAVASAAVVPRLRPAVAAAFVLPPLVEWRRTRPPFGPVAWLGLRWADDLAYGAGVWTGALRSRSTACLRPDLTGGTRLPA